jgi:hypothetical protein
MPTCPKCGHVFTEPVTPPSTGTIFPHRIVFERESDEGYGIGAIVLFPSLADADVTYVSVNAEIAKKAHPYNGHPVFTLVKPGDQYLRPLKFVIKMSDGAVYTKEGEAATPPVTPDAPSSGKTLTVKNSGQANGNRSHFRFPSKVAAYGNFSFSFDGGKVHYVTAEQVKDGRHEPGGGVLVKSPDNRGGTAILGEYGKTYKSCTLKW